MLGEFLEFVDLRFEATSHPAFHVGDGASEALQLTDDAGVVVVGEGLAETFETRAGKPIRLADPLVEAVQPRDDVFDAGVLVRRRIAREQHASAPEQHRRRRGRE